METCLGSQTAFTRLRTSCLFCGKEPPFLVNCPVYMEAGKNLVATSVDVYSLFPVQFKGHGESDQLGPLGRRSWERALAQRVPPG